MARGEHKVFLLAPGGEQSIFWCSQGGGKPFFLPAGRCFYKRRPRNKCNLPSAPKKNYDKIARACQLILYNKKRNFRRFRQKLGSDQDSSSGCISGSRYASNDFETSIERGARRRSSCKKILGKGSKIKKLGRGGPISPPPVIAACRYAGPCRVKHFCKKNSSSSLLSLLSSSSSSAYSSSLSSSSSS